MPGIVGATMSRTAAASATIPSRTQASWRSWARIRRSSWRSSSCGRSDAGFHDQHCTLASGVRLPYTRRAPERQRATRRCPGASTGGPGARAIHPTREEDDEPDPPDPCHSRRRARRCDGRAARSSPRSRGQRGADRGARARRGPVRSRRLARALGVARERGRADERLPRRRDLDRDGAPLRRDARGRPQGRDALRPAGGLPARGRRDVRRAERRGQREGRRPSPGAVERPGRGRRGRDGSPPAAADRRWRALRTRADRRSARATSPNDPSRSAASPRSCGPATAAS